MAPTTKEGQRAELHKTIWRIANDLRGSVDGWEFKSYVLGLLFYRFISENLAAYINSGEQEINLTTYNLARINMFLHDVPYDQFNLALGDTLNGTAAIVEFPGVLYRGGAERKIRKNVIDNNYVDAVIQLPPDLFFGTTIATCIIVLKKSKLTEANRKKILDAFTTREDTDYFTKLVPNEEIAANAYNIAVSSYVEAEDTREIIDITVLNAQIARIVARQAELRIAIDAIVADLEGTDLEASTS
ncbi:hypothetical protein GCM10027052_10410 [Parafrigoribacterium mesophilum]|uniref:N-6 DNA methylase n=1 Tax=Parafrigoribacterium mesophilum TaxID=433646 RepID=UPI0031FD8CCD